MNINILEKEKEYLLELLYENHKELLRELHNTDTRDYKQMLKDRLILIEQLQAKLALPTYAAAATQSR